MSGGDLMALRVEIQPDHVEDPAWMDWAERAGLDASMVSVDPGYLIVDRDASTISYLTPVLDDHGDVIPTEDGRVERHEVTLTCPAPIPPMPCES
jgi:hypothetical protein